MSTPERPLPAAGDPGSEIDAARRRTRMVERDLRQRGIRNERVLAAMLTVPRHRFVAPSLAKEAYADSPLPTRDGQTISQPYIVALMTEALDLTPGMRVLEIGTGTGYQTAVLAELGASVWSIESSLPLYEEAHARLRDLGVARVCLRCGDGTPGWPELAPFDRILATGSLPAVPSALLGQLRRCGVFVGPIGHLGQQRLVRIEVDPPALHEQTLSYCSFVPLVGRSGWPSGTREEGS